MGALQISAYKTDASQSPGTVLREYLSDEGIVAAIAEYSSNASRIATGFYENDSFLTKVWVITQKDTLLFVTYNAETRPPESELQEADSIIRSVKLLNESA